MIRDAAEMRVKETDRIEVVTRYLAEMGARIEATPDGMVIEGPTGAAQIEARLHAAV